MSRIDDAVRRTLTLKFEMGLFEAPFADRSYQDTIRSEEHLELARKAVRESQVLLRNEDETLPLDEDIEHIHVTGRFADDIGAQSGGWTIEWQGVRGNDTAGTSVLDAISDRAGSDLEVTSSRSAERAGEDIEDADVTIAVVGEAPYAEFEGDRERLELHEEDIDLIEKASGSNTPLVVVLLSGRPLVLTDELPMMDALLASWLPGSEASGIADILFGDNEPTGRLPMTWPRRNSQIPLQVDGDKGETWTAEEARSAGYGVVGQGESDVSDGELEKLPLFPYGFGLTYRSGR
ncbi:MAG: glycoside hydrolase family 3 protein [Spirochaetales bacterium]